MTSPLARSIGAARTVAPLPLSGPVRFVVVAFVTVFGPAGPVAPVAPAGPVAPVEPGAPVGPVGPTSPLRTNPTTIASPLAPSGVPETFVTGILK